MDTARFDSGGSRGLVRTFVSGGEAGGTGEPGSMGGGLSRRGGDGGGSGNLGGGSPRAARISLAFFMKSSKAVAPV